MVKAFFILHRKADMDMESFRRYWKDTHGPIAAKIPGLRKYVQYHAVPGAMPGDSPCDGVAELWFDSPEAMQAALTSPEGAATMGDIPNFMDASRSGAIVVEEVQVV